MPTKKAIPPKDTPKKAVPQKAAVKRAAPKKAALKKITPPAKLVESIVPPAEPIMSRILPFEPAVPAAVAVEESVVAAPAPVVTTAPAIPAPAPVLPVPPQAPYIQPQPMAPGDERTWGMFSHLSVLLNLITGFAGPIAALVVYLIYKDRSRFVAYHALQAMIFQLIWWCGGGVLIGVMWAIVGALSAILVGIVLIPFALLCTPVFALLPLGAIIYGIVGAVQTSQGQDFKYWLVGDWVRGTLTG